MREGNEKHKLFFKRLVIFILSAILLISSAGLINAADWPMFGHDVENSGVADSALNGITNPEYLWNFTTDNSIGPGSPVMGNIDDDSDLEVIVPTAGFSGNPGVYALDSDGTQLWKYPTGGYGTYATPNLVNLDGDSKLEIISVALADTIFALDDDGTVLWSKTKGSGSFSGGTCTVADISSSPGLEVVAGAASKTYLLKASDGTELWNANYRVLSDPTVADVDLDGSMEIIFPCSGSVIVALNDDGSTLWTSTPAGQDFQGNVVIINDINGDGQPDLAAGSRDKNLYVYSGADGTLLWSYPVVGRCFTAAAADFNSDGFDEVVTTATKADGVESYVYLLDVKNQVLLWKHNIIGMNMHTTERGPSIADVDEDGSLDVVVAGSSMNMYALDGTDGSELWSISTLDDDGGRSPAIGDINGDGVMDIAVTHGNYVQVISEPEPCLPCYDEVWVDDDADPGWYDCNHVATTQEGVDAVCDGGTVTVYDGLYDEVVVIDKEDVTVQSGSLPVIQPTTTGSWPGAVNIVADGVTFTGFEVDASLAPKIGINAYGASDVNITNNIVHGADHTWDAIGIIAWDWTSASTVDDILIENNEVYDTGRMGIFCMDYDTDNSEYDLTEGHIIRGNTVYNTWTNTFGDEGGAIQINAGKDCEIYDNLVYDTQNGNRGIYMFGSGSGNTISCNILRDNAIGIQLWIDAVGGSPIDWEGDTATSPKVNYNEIYDNTNYGAYSINLTGTPMVMDAECNWWGDHSGPYHSTNPTGIGNAVSDNVDFDPYIFVDADAGGPYADDGSIQFDGSGTDFGACGTVSYNWDFGDGTSGTGVNPSKTYMNRGTPYNVKLTVTITTQCGKTYSDSDTTTATRLDGGDPPVISLIYPVGGEILSGVETVKWYAIDEDFSGEENDLPIYMFYSVDGGMSWRQIDGVLYNDGEYDLDTTGFSDGEYMLKVEAVHQGIAVDTSDVFTIDNGNAGLCISDVRVTDESIDSYDWVKDGDKVEVTAGITGSNGLSASEITADLSGFGLGSSVAADSFDGFTAKWSLSSVSCQPKNGEIVVTVTADSEVNSCVITSDNVDPSVKVVRPTTGLYLFNHRLFRFLPRTIVIGSVTVGLELDDSNGISRAEFYIDELDNDPEGLVTDDPFEWTVNKKLRGQHVVKVLVYDLAGNVASDTLEFSIFIL